jgi:hypothetical protein
MQLTMVSIIISTMVSIMVSTMVSIMVSTMLKFAMPQFVMELMTSN